MAGHITKRKVCAKDNCGGTIRARTVPEQKRANVQHWEAGRCTKCGGRKYNTKWRARYPDPTRGGTAQIERNFDRRLDGDRWLTEQRASVQRGTHIDPRNTERRLRIVVDGWRSTWVDLEPKTKAGYESILNKHVLPRWREAQIGAVSAEVVQDWINELAAKLSPKTVRNVYGVMRSLMQFAIARHFITVNPCDSVKLPRRRSKPKEDMIVLTPQEVAAVAEAITPRHRLIVYVAAYGGLRAGEIEALRRRDADVLRSRLSVVLALKDINTSSENIAPEEKGLIFGAPKNGETRIVVVPRFLNKMIAAHLEADTPPTAQGYPAVDNAGELRWTDDPADPDRLLFTSTEGEPIRHDNFYRRHFKPAVKRRFCESCGTIVTPDDESCPDCGDSALAYVLPPSKHGLRFHDLRHTCASMLIAEGAHPKAIQDHLGHKDIQTTFNVYGHMLPSAQEALGAALDAAYERQDDDEDEDGGSNVVPLRP
jgi:integrase